MGDGDGENMSGWGNKGTTCPIKFSTPCIRDRTCQIGGRTCRIRFSN